LYCELHDLGPRRLFFPEVGDTAAGEEGAAGTTAPCASAGGPQIRCAAHPCPCHLRRRWELQHRPGTTARGRAGASRWAARASNHPRRASLRRLPAAAPPRRRRPRSRRVLAWNVAAGELDRPGRSPPRARIASPAAPYRGPPLQSPEECVARGRRRIFASPHVSNPKWVLCLRFLLERVFSMQTLCLTYFTFGSPFASSVGAV
jgi:hypothetical protein